MEFLYIPYTQTQSESIGMPEISILSPRSGVFTLDLALDLGQSWANAFIRAVIYAFSAPNSTFHLGPGIVWREIKRNQRS